MTKEEFQERTFQFGIRAVRFARRLPKEVANDVFARQLIKCSSSVGANYRAVCRAKSKADAIAKFGIVEEECDESLFWLEFIAEANGNHDEELRELLTEGRELLAMTVASINTMKRSLGK